MRNGKEGVHDRVVEVYLCRLFQNVSLLQPLLSCQASRKVDMCAVSVDTMFT